MKKRIEHDTMGEIEIPADCYWGAQTQRSLTNFSIGEKASMPKEIIFAFAILKKAAAAANYELGILTKEKRNLIFQVCEEIKDGKLQNHFPLVIWQTGSGTHTNMNLNEVIANRANFIATGNLENSKRILHPNDDVNKSQSSNDTFPTAMNIAAYLILTEKTLPALNHLLTALQEKSKNFKNHIKVGRTHWMDATPITLGQEFSGYAAQLKAGIKTLKQILPRLKEIALGATAVGTGLNAPENYAKLVAQNIAQQTKHDFVTAPNKFMAIASHDDLVAVHGVIKQIAVSIFKILHDLRAMASGPRCGLGEIVLPANEPGSSIMPGKVNPTQIEACSMVCAQIFGNDTTISFAAANGHFELNVFKPVIIAAFLQSARLLADTCLSLTNNCIKGIKANNERMDHNLEKSLMLVTALNPHIGYENACLIAKTAYAQDKTLKQVALELNLVSSENFDLWVNPKNMLMPKK